MGPPSVEDYLRAARLITRRVRSMVWPRSGGPGDWYLPWMAWRAFDVADRELLHLFHAECGDLLDSPSSEANAEASKVFGLPGVNVRHWNWSWTG